MKQIVIYVLSDRSNKGKYKVGTHTGSFSNLKHQYIKSIPDLEIHYFIETNNSKSIEYRFKETHRNNRIVSNNGNFSKWYLLSLDEIISSLTTLIDDTNTIIISNNPSSTEIRVYLNKLNPSNIPTLVFGLAQTRALSQTYYEADDFVSIILQKYTDCTGNPNDGVRASYLSAIIEFESNKQICRGKVKGIMESLEGGKYKQRKMSMGHQYYPGMKLKDIYTNIFTY